MKICFATQNENKLREIQALLDPTLELVSLSALGQVEPLLETQDTLEGNATQKATYVYQKYQMPCFSDDSGLEVAALGGAPGVYSARYAGPERSDAANISLLLKNLKGKDRSAQFRTVIAFIDAHGVTHYFEGIAEGTIAEEPRGTNGFAYDCLFIPKGPSQTYGEMPLVEKNKMSARSAAFRKLIGFLNPSD